MGADYFANEDGDFEIVIYDSQGNELESVGVEIEPNEGVYTEVVEGRHR